MKRKGRAGEIDRELGIQLRVMRVEQGVSQSELAKRMSVSYQQIQKYEHGTTRVTVARLLEIASALGVSVGSIIHRLEPTDAPKVDLSTKPDAPALPALKGADIAMMLDFEAITDPKHRSTIRTLCRALAERVSL